MPDDNLVSSLGTRYHVAMKRLLTALALVSAAILAPSCSRSETPSAITATAAPQAALVDAGSEGPARALGLKLGFAFTTNLMGELEPCG